MFGDSETHREIVDALLELYDFLDLLELNDLTHEEVTLILLQGGHLGYPREVIDGVQV